MAIGPVAHAGAVFLDVLPDLKRFHAAMTAETTGFRAKGLLLGGAIAAGVGAAMAKSVDIAVEFESAFAGVRKTVDATEPQFAKLEADIRQMAKTLPATTTEISAVAEAAGQLGVKREAIKGFARVMIDLGETTNLTSDQAANALARLGNIMGTSQKKFDRMGSTIVDLGNKGAATESEITEMALRIAGAGEQIGLTEAQVFAFSEALSSVGVRAEAGGSSISKVFIEMSKEIRDGSDSAALLAEVAGESIGEFTRLFETDAAGAMTKFVEGLGRMKKAGGDVFGVLEKLGWEEIRMRDALLRLAGAGDLLNNSLKTGAQAWRDNSALAEEARERYETFESKLQIFKNRVNDLQLTMGQKLLPVATDVLEWLTDSIKPAGELGEAFRFINQEWGRIQRSFGDGLAWLALKWADFAEFFYEIGDDLLRAAEAALGWMPGYSEKIREFRDNYRESTAEVLADIRRKAHEWEQMGETAKRNFRLVGEEIVALSNLIQTTDLTAPGTIRAEIPRGNVGTSRTPDRGRERQQGPEITRFSIDLDGRQVSRVVETHSRRNRVLLGGRGEP